MSTSEETICLVGLGYVGLPVAVSMASHFKTIGYDISEKRLSALRNHDDCTGEVSGDQLREANIDFTSSPEDIGKCSFIIVAVPTPIDESKVPDLTPLIDASVAVGKSLQKGAVVVYESTVFPGATEEVCVPVLERESGLSWGKDFFVGYSPERINPGDKEHTFENIVKVVSGDSPETLERVSSVYGAVVTAGIHKAPSIRVAEAAKVIENTQRDLNIALMNELALIFDRMDIRTSDVIAAASTKWNFLPFSPGLVGGHCIGVDPYYLTSKAQQLGYQPQVILAGRRINNHVGAFVARKTVKLLKKPSEARVGVLGLAFKENVPDLRNSQVPTIIQELRSFGVSPLVHDPLANAQEALSYYGLHLSDWDELQNLDALIYAVPHQFYEQIHDILLGKLQEGGAFVDIKSRLTGRAMPRGIRYWSL